MGFVSSDDIDKSIEETFRIMIPFDEMMCIDSYEHGLDYLTDKLK